MLVNHLNIEMVAIDAFCLPDRKLKKHPRAQNRKIAASIERFGMNVPILIDENNEVLAGVATLEACSRLKFEAAPAIRITHLDEGQKRLFRIAHNRIAEDARWAPSELKLELEELSIKMPELDLTLSGIEITDIDRMLGNDANDLSRLDHPVEPDHEAAPVTRCGDLWLIGEHGLLCGDATSADDMTTLMGDGQARLFLTDPPYNVPINEHVSGLGKHQHREFAMAAGEMSSSEFEGFLGKLIAAAAAHICDGGLFYVFMDAKHLIDLELAARSQDLATLTICVWVKDNAGMPDDQELRRNWRTRWLSSIQEFADDETQRRLWLDRANTNPHFSFVEYFCCYFDDLNLSDGGYDWALSEGMLSADEVTAVVEFHRAADTYDSPTDDYDHQAILADPKWAEVVAAAKRAQDVLAQLIDHPYERRVLLEP